MRVGDCVGNYRLGRLIAQGGMGAVYEARNEQLGRRVALKVLHASYAHQREHNLRFFNEARTANRVNHPGLVAVHEYGMLPDGTAFIVMEYLEGRTLAQLVHSQGSDPLPTCQSVRIARQVAAALSAAHDRGVVHRDLKPDNLMLVPDSEASGGERIKVLDFGIAKFKDELTQQAGLTRVGMGMGTPGYVAPEQIYGASSVNGRADVYSLGIILYELLGGVRPFQGQTGEEELRCHLTRQPTPLQERAPGLAPALVELVHAMLAKQPEQRPSMQEVLQQLNSLDFSTIGAGAVARQNSPRRLSRWALLGAVLFSALFLSMSMHALYPSRVDTAPHFAKAQPAMTEVADAGVATLPTVNGAQQAQPSKPKEEAPTAARRPLQPEQPKARPTRARQRVKDPLDEDTIVHLR